MSATGRGAVRDLADYYATPRYCVHRMLEAVELPGGRWLEPSAGEGHLIRAVQELRQDIAWTAVEVRRECLRALFALGLDSVQIDSFTASALPLRHARFDVVIMNPPFRSALAFVQRALELAPVVVALLRLNWLASEERAAWMRAHTPAVYVLPNRPSFTGSGGDACEYAWLVWSDRPAQVHVLHPTPAEERRGHLTPRECGQLGLF